MLKCLGNLPVGISMQLYKQQYKHLPVFESEGEKHWATIH